jgi:hypothetical protein
MTIYSSSYQMMLHARMVYLIDVRVSVSIHIVLPLCSSEFDPVAVRVAALFQSPRAWHLHWHRSKYCQASHLGGLLAESLPYANTLALHKLAQ